MFWEPWAGPGWSEDIQTVEETKSGEVEGGGRRSGWGGGLPLS